MAEFGMVSLGNDSKTGWMVEAGEAYTGLYSLRVTSISLLGFLREYTESGDTSGCKGF